jgi:hypothetical protein
VVANSVKKTLTCCFLPTAEIRFVETDVCVAALISPPLKTMLQTYVSHLFFLPVSLEMDMGFYTCNSWYYDDIGGVAV